MSTIITYNILILYLLEQKVNKKKHKRGKENEKNIGDNLDYCVDYAFNTA